MDSKPLKKSGVIAISIIAGLVVVALILVLSFSNPNSGKNSEEKKSADSAIADFIAASDAVAGENNSEIKKQLTPEEVAGYYIDDGDGWYYKFDLGGAEGYGGTFSAGFDSAHSSAEQNPQKHVTMNGAWKLENGEIKLFSEGVYRSSMWACDGYIVDSLNYFVGEIDPEKDHFQSVFASKAGESGDAQIFNFYDDGKMIIEIIRNAGTNDAADSAASDNILPAYQMHAGTYEKKDNKVVITIGESSQEFYVVNDGLAKWIYNKK